MTEAGNKVLTALLGGPATVAEIKVAIHLCARKTRSTVMGCQLAGLVEPVPDSVPLQVELTAEGRALVQP